MTLPDDVGLLLDASLLGLCKTQYFSIFVVADEGHPPDASSIDFPIREVLPTPQIQVLQESIKDGL